MQNAVNCTRLFADENGDSHFEDFEITMTELQYAPPTPPMGISDPVEASRYTWFRFPADWSDDGHPSPRRQMFIVLAGAVKVWTSKGDKRVFSVSDRLLMEDTTGKGHGAQSHNGAALGLVIAFD